MRFIVLAVGLVALGGCQATKNKQAIETAQAASRDCDTQTFKTAVARARCKNAAMEMARGAAGGSADLLNVVQAKRMVLAERLDKGQITQAEADLEMAQTMAGAGSEERSRNAQIRASQPVTCTSTRVFGNLQTTCD